MNYQILFDTFTLCQKYSFKTFMHINSILPCKIHVTYSVGENACRFFSGGIYCCLRCISPGNASSRMNTLFDVAWTRKSSHNNVEKLLLKRLISGKTRWRNVFFDVTSSRGKRNKLCAWKRSKRRLLCLFTSRKGKESIPVLRHY